MSEFISKMEKLRADFNSKNSYEAKFGFIGKSQIKELEDVVIPAVFKDLHKDKQINYKFSSGFTKLMGLTLYCVEYDDYFKVG